MKSAELGRQTQLYINSTPNLDSGKTRSTDDKDKVTQIGDLLKLWVSKNNVKKKANTSRQTITNNLNPTKISGLKLQ